MKNFIFIVIVLLSEIGFSQAIPTNRYYPNKSILDLVNNPPSFAYSLRKLKKNYSGFAIKIRRGTDNAEANVAFATNGVVSASSTVTVTAVGSSGLTVGQNIVYSTFIGAQTIFVTRWYDQGSNVYDAIQTTAAAQPIIQLNIAGFTNNLPSIIFDGNKNLVVNQPIENLVLSGINGTLLMVAKTTSSSSQFSFGNLNSSSGDWRWSSHLNWNDGNCYFDASEVCCASNRAFANGVNVNLFKLYTFIRGTTYKTILVNSVATVLNNSSASSVSRTGGVFGIGNINSSTSAGYIGNFSEVIMFKKDYNKAIIKFLETNQINFWLK